MEGRNLLEELELSLPGAGRVGTWTVSIVPWLHSATASQEGLVWAPLLLPGVGSAEDSQ